MKKIAIKMLTTCLSLLILTSSVQAEMVTRDEALTVAKNWVTLIIHQEGDWGGSETAEVKEIQEFKRGERVIGYFCRVKPRGFIVISLRKELAPVKAYSAISELNPESEEGMADLIKAGIERVLNAIEKQLGPIELARTQDVQSVLEVNHRPTWEKLERDVKTFEAGLESGVIEMGYEPGTWLLTSNWHQGEPYNWDCPSDDGCDHCKVGCVALAGAQIMRYWNWPPCKYPFTVWYDWPNMPDTLTTSSPQVQTNAVAKLCYEVGHAAATDYGCNESTAWCGDCPGCRDMVEVYEEHFYYSDGAYFDLRAGESSADWFDKIKNNLNNNRPLQYCTATVDFPGIAGHSMVCDGWKTVGSSLYCHMNDGSLAWLDMTDLPGAEGMIRGIKPDCSLGSSLSGSYVPPSFPYRYFDQDATGSNADFGSGHKLQFLPGVKVTCTSTTGGKIEFRGTSAYNTYLFTRGDLSNGIRILNSSKIHLYQNGSIKLH